ncbi:hypothetical protein ACPPVO_02400 [Dactylosporangium sp. McL0621]|uniref:hypothetical protein n=1 Tax=Dactylosporangium sp. McL0621 TaxID=3415678 RepID=UPI003CF41791
MEDAGSNPVGLPIDPRELPLWRNIRAEMPPPELVAAAASARARGDWRAAATLMPVTVDVDLAVVRARFGAGPADRLEDDLRHLALDLLWWHLPRHRGGRSTLQAQVAAVLAPRARASGEPLLHLRLPQSPTGPQRAHLSVVTLADLRDQRWYYAPRYTWDVRETGGLAEQWAAPEVFALLAAGDYHQAWRHCGITLDFDDLSCLQRPATSPTSPVGVATLAREAAEAFGVDRVATMLGAYPDPARVLTAGGAVRPQRVPGDPGAHSDVVGAAGSRPPHRRSSVAGGTAPAHSGRCHEKSDTS